MEEVKERGAAEVIIDLHGGVITVRHGEGSHPILAQWTAQGSDWDKLWERITELKTIADNACDFDPSNGVDVCDKNHTHGKVTK